MNRAAYGNYPDLTGVKKILVVKLRHLGDVLLAAPVFAALKKKIPDVHLDAFIWAECAPMLEGHPAVDGWILYDRAWKQLGARKIFKEISLFWHIRRQKYDVVINLTEGDRGAWAARVSGAPIRIGWGKKGVYTHFVKQCSGLRHTVERNLDALRRMGVFPQEEDKELFLHVPDGLMQATAEMIGSSSFILIHPSSRWRFKCWPIQQMRSLAHQLLERGERLVFTSGPDPVEIEMVNQIVEGLEIVNLAGKISLKELAALIRQAKAIICVDSVPLHMASALKAPVVALFGPTSEITWGPWRHERARVVVQPMSCRPCYQDGCGGSKVSDCLSSLPVAKVLAAYDSLCIV
ncbi:MAG: putative lipopolysaccharide heptosyltransferase III [Chlamydiales bacterium]|nr:putative lipopolysaccharide heptosyltransferase III [Chlamydiales bacterium]